MENTKSSASWWLVQLTTKAPDDALTTIIELGAVGASTTSSNNFEATFYGDDGALKEFQNRLMHFDINVGTVSQMEERNWVQQCKEIWQPIVVGRLTILPVIGQHAPPKQKNVIPVIPGGGFGTGHHQSTRQALELLQSDYIKDPQNALDVGAGNGILSLAFVELFGAKVDALEIDEAAIINAQETIALTNYAPEMISIHRKSLDKSFGMYDLIMANIYAEVLVDLEPQFRAHLNPEGMLILAGVVDTSLDMISSGFSKSDWAVIEQVDYDGWIGLLLKIQK